MLTCLGNSLRGTAALDPSKKRACSPFLRLERGAGLTGTKTSCSMPSNFVGGHVQGSVVGWITGMLFRRFHNWKTKRVAHSADWSEGADISDRIFTATGQVDGEGGRR